MGISPDMPVPNNDNGNYTVHSNDSTYNPNLPNPYAKDEVVYKNEETFDREKINQEVMEKMQKEPEKKANKLKVLWNKLFGKKLQQPQYNYADNIPPYDK